MQDFSVINPEFLIRRQMVNGMNIKNYNNFLLKLKNK